MQSVILSVASGLMLALTTFMARKIASEMGTFHSEFDAINRQAESYWALGGNSYVKALVHHANNDMEIHGTLPA